MRFNAIFVFALLAITLTGCRNRTQPPPPTPPEQPKVVYPTEAQPKLPTIKLWLGSEELTAEMALTDLQVQTGMMFRTNIAEDEGMIFVFAAPRRAAFWMKNCVIPLSAAYIDPDGVILEIHDLHPGNTNSVVANSPNVQFVLETSQGWFERNNISTGTLVRTDKGSLRETFLRR